MDGLQDRIDDYIRENIESILEMYSDKVEGYIDDNLEQIILARKGKVKKILAEAEDYRKDKQSLDL